MASSPYLIDSSAWIFALQRNAVPVIKERIAELLGTQTVLTIGLINLELLGGTRSKGEFERLRHRLSALHSIPTDAGLWRRAAELAFELRRKGLSIPSTDTLIAAAAMAEGATVVHADRHFDLMREVADLEVESLLDFVPSR